MDQKYENILRTHKITFLSEFVFAFLYELTKFSLGARIPLATKDDVKPKPSPSLGGLSRFFVYENMH